MLASGPATEAIKPGLRGEHEGSRNTIVQGMPVDFGGPVVTSLVCFLHLHARLWVYRAPGIPCALFVEEDAMKGMARTRLRREIARPCCLTGKSENDANAAKRPGSIRHGRA